MYGKRSPRYTAKIFPTNSLKRHVRGPLTETAVPNSRNYQGNGHKFSAQRFVGLFGWESVTYDWLMVGKREK